MPAPKGHPRYGGRTKGTPNKLTKTVREAINETFNSLQDDPSANLLEWAKTNPSDFYRLAARLIPIDLGIQSGVSLQVVTGVPKAELEK